METGHATSHEDELSQFAIWAAGGTIVVFALAVLIGVVASFSNFPALWTVSYSLLAMSVVLAFVFRVGKALAKRTERTSNQ